MKELMLAVKNCMADLNYSEYSISHYEEVWKRFFKYSTSDTLNTQQVSLFLKDVFCYDGSNKPTRYQRTAIRAMNVLLYYQSHHKIYIRFPLKNPKVMKTPFDDIRRKYTDFLHDSDYSMSTIHTHDRVLKNLFEFLYSTKGLNDILKIKYEDISDFILDITSHKGKVSYELNVLRVFFRYMFSTQLTEFDLSLLIPSSNILKTKEHLPSYWNDDELKSIFSKIDRSTPCEKRDYAVMILAFKLGLRVSDIRNLRFKNIDWNLNTISIIQTKTGEALVLPLIKEVGEGIIDYIKNARPKHSSDYIFITLKAPYHPLSDSTHFHNVINKYIKKAGIAISKERLHGMHTLRHTLATRLLSQGTPLSVISGILGHKNMKTTCEYLRVDIEKLSCCTLEAGAIHES